MSRLTKLILFNLLNVVKMKKLVLFLAVATAVAFASCGNKEAKQEAPATEEPAVEVVDEVATPAEEEIVAPAEEVAIPAEEGVVPVEQAAGVIEAVKADVETVKEVVKTVDTAVKTIEETVKK